MARSHAMQTSRGARSRASCVVTAAVSALSPCCLCAQISSDGFVPDGLCVTDTLQSPALMRALVATARGGGRPGPVRYLLLRDYPRALGVSPRCVCVCVCACVLTLLACVGWTGEPSVRVFPYATAPAARAFPERAYSLAVWLNVSSTPQHAVRRARGPFGTHMD